MSAGYVSILEDEPNICKIGFSKYRNKQIGCTYHKDFKLVGFFKSETAEKGPIYISPQGEMKPAFRRPLPKLKELKIKMKCDNGNSN